MFHTWGPSQLLFTPLFSFLWVRFESSFISRIEITIWKLNTFSWGLRYVYYQMQKNLLPNPQRPKEVCHLECVRTSPVLSSYFQKCIKPSETFLWKFLVGFILVERYKLFSTDLSLWKDYNFCSVGVWPGIVTCFCQWYVSGSDMWHFWEQTRRTVTGCATSCFPRLWDRHVLIVEFFFRLFFPNKEGRKWNCSQHRMWGIGWLIFVE